MPRVVDMRVEHRSRRAGDPDDRRLHLLGPTLEREIEGALRAGGQVILLLNRRGFASYVWCRSAACGFVAGCEHCDANLVVHRTGGLPAGGIVRCHHCDAEQRVPVLCPSCGGKVALWGGGTQRAEEELVSKFASLGIVEGRTLLRVDSDTMHGARDYFEALSRFGRGEVRVLVGTQMLAKGLDYPNVVLVGVLDADLSLNIPDFRSSERTFQLVSQVAGRAGRGAHPGLVVVQTHPRSRRDHLRAPSPESSLSPLLPPPLSPSPSPSSPLRPSTLVSLLPPSSPPPLSPPPLPPPPLPSSPPPLSPGWLPLPPPSPQWLRGFPPAPPPPPPPPSSPPPSRLRAPERRKDGGWTWTRSR